MQRELSVLIRMASKLHLNKAVSSVRKSSELTGKEARVKWEEE